MENNNLRFTIEHPIFVSVSEAARLAGVQDKTIRRALKAASGELKFKIVYNRYQIDLASLLTYVHKKTKLKNKLNNQGLGQYVKVWQETPSPPTILNHQLMKKLKAEKDK